MDSLTQIALGAAVGIAIGGRTHGRKTALIGAIVGTLPDLDVLYDYGDPISNFTYHRSLSHSLVFSILMTPVLVFLLSCMKWFKGCFSDLRVHAMIFAILVTHIGLDALTIYGTQIFWPFPAYPVGVGSIFIVDPLYTVPLLVGVVWFLCNKNWNANRVALIVCTLYLLFSVSAQNTVRDIAVAQMDEKPSYLLVQPTPFNTLLWRVLVVKDQEYQVGYYSLFDQDKAIDFKTYPRAVTALNPLSNEWSVQRLQWFTKGFYGVDNVNGHVVISDLRMGLEPDQYVFQFIVGDANGNPVANERFSGVRDMSRLKQIWKRIFDETVEI